jgi:hypothetical protein
MDIFIFLLTFDEKFSERFFGALENLMSEIYDIKINFRNGLYKNLVIPKLSPSY